MERTRVVQSRLDDDLFDRLQKICEIKGMKVSEYIRQAIRHCVDSEKDMYKVIMQRMREAK